MHKRESILSSLVRPRKDSSRDGWRSEANSPRGTAPASPQGLSPTVSGGSLRSVKSTSSISSAMPKSSPKHEGAPVRFKISLETPPAIMYGTPQDSAGALISGICDVDLSGSGSVSGVVDLLDVSMAIIQEIEFRLPPPVARKLPNGARQRNVLATWDILKHPHILASTTFAYPFSHLLPGTLPPTCSTELFSIKYSIEASATTKDQKKSQMSLPLKIGRSVLGLSEKTSVRIFPPTPLNLSMVLPTALFPNSQVQAEMRVENLVSEAPAPQSAPSAPTLRFKRWQLKRVNWRVDEMVKIRLSDNTDHEVKQTIGYGVHKSGWKTDYALQNGNLEFFSPDFCPGVLKNANKDVLDPVSGISLSHQLVCELLIAEEVLASPSAKQGILSGSARVLRMQFAFPVVDRPGLGISWEDEVPPMYADIPLSPPQYKEVADLPALEEFRTNALVFSPLLVPQMSPTLRHFDPSRRGFEHQPGSDTPGSVSGSSTPKMPSLSPTASSQSIPTQMNLLHPTTSWQPTPVDDAGPMPPPKVKERQS